MSEEKKNITKFIERLSSKNYAKAHKYLKQVVEDKILKRINKATEKPLF
jgi:hypothetical protein|tara:strand:+ start:174 stop:320 length:147 start_codon:yes stop_codon:yes gene_type:complete